MEQIEANKLAGIDATEIESQFSMPPAYARSRSCSARNVLKRETYEIHQRLHDLPAFVDLMKGRISPRRYQKVMSGFLDFYEVFDQAAIEASQRFKKQLRGNGYVPRTPLLRTDVNELGGRINGGTRSRLSVSNFGSVAEYVGALYVVDGSVLGGATMNKALKRNSKLPGEDGRAYWRWCQTGGLKQWQSTLKLVETSWQKDDNHAAISASAMRTFSILHDHLSGATAHE